MLELSYLFQTQLGTMQKTKQLFNIDQKVRTIVGCLSSLILGKGKTGFSQMLQKLKV